MLRGATEDDAWRRSERSGGRVSFSAASDPGHAGRRRTTKRAEEIVANESLDEKVFDVPAEFRKTAWISSMEQYQEMYRRSLDDADAFWAEEAEKTAALVQEVGLRAEPRLRQRQGPLVRGRQAERRLQLPRPPSREPATATKSPTTSRATPRNPTRTITYQQLWEQVTKFANVLKKKGVKKGDRVVIYLPMIPELPVAMLACARIGAIHCVVFGGFSAEALRDRVLNAGATLMITADTGLRGGKPDPAQDRADAAMAECPDVKTCIVVKHTGTDIPWTEGRDVWYRRRDGRRRHHHRLPVRRDGRGRSALHPLHLRLHGQTQGRHAHHRRLPALRRHDPRAHLRLPSRAGLLVHGRHRLGHRPHLHRVRPAGQRRHRHPVRGRPQLPDARTASGPSSRSTRPTSSTPPPPPCAPSPAKATTGSRSTTSPRCACWAPWASPSTRKSGCGTTTSSAAAAARSWTPGGRPRPAASSSPRCRAR